MQQNQDSFYTFKYRNVLLSNFNEFPYMYFLLLCIKTYGAFQNHTFKSLLFFIYFCRKGGNINVKSMN